MGSGAVSVPWREIDRQAMPSPRPPVTIPLYRPDFTGDDARVCLSQLARAPFVDAGAARAWEAGWERLWERRAVAFASHDEALGAVKGLFGWRSGDVVAVDPLLDPAWIEALEANWLHAAWRDIDPVTGRVLGGPPARAEGSGVTRAVVTHHPFGLPVPGPDSGVEARHDAGDGARQVGLPDTAPVILEEISAIVHPLPGIGQGRMQMVNLEGPRILPVGVGCVLLSTDEPLIEALRKRRSRPPGGPACALGCALLASLPGRLERRAELAGRYLALRLRGLGTLPAQGAHGRTWELFHLVMRDARTCSALRHFLQRSGIGCATPVWFAPRLPEGIFLPGLHALQTRALALPLHAALTNPESKRIVNRIHRWAERCGQSQPPPHDDASPP